MIGKLSGDLTLSLSQSQKMAGFFSSRRSATLKIDDFDIKFDLIPRSMDFKAPIPGIQSESKTIGIELVQLMQIKPEEPMTEYLTMAQAFECGDDDIPYIEDGFNSDSKCTKKDLCDNRRDFKGSMQDLIEWSTSDKWQVQKAEPKVLTAEDIFKNRFLYEQPTVEEASIAMLEDAIKNGQRKEWNRTKELRGLAESWVNSHQGDLPEHSLVRKFAVALENLTPPD